VRGMPSLESAAYNRRRLLLLAEEVVGPDVLDIGYAQLPNVYLGSHNVTGLDLMEPNGPQPGYARTVRGDATRIVDIFGASAFDTVVFGELIEHLEEPYEFLRGVRSVVRPGGRIVLSTPNPMAFPVIFFEAMRSDRFFYTADHVYYFLPRWIRRMLERTGFSLVKALPVGLWLPLPFVVPCPVALSYQVVYVATPV